MKKRIAFYSLVLFVLGSGYVSAAQQSGCVRCHTDEGAMKSLFVAPKIEGGEGEG